MHVMTRLDVEDRVLREALGECLAWCGARALVTPARDDVRGVLRSAELRDLALRCLPPCVVTDIVGEYDERRSSSHAVPIHAAFADFARARSDLALRAGATPSDLVDRELERPQALMFAFWQYSIWDWASMEASDGYVDEWELPPWDTWLALAKWPGQNDPDTAAIVAWVPEWARERADAGIRVAAGGNIEWIHRMESGFGITVWRPD
jgi:hypothetical protein